MYWLKYIYCAQTLRTCDEKIGIAPALRVMNAAGLTAVQHSCHACPPPASNTLSNERTAQHACRPLKPRPRWTAAGDGSARAAENIVPSFTLPHCRNRSHFTGNPPHKLKTVQGQSIFHDDHPRPDS